MMKASAPLWRQWFYWFINRVYFARIAVLNRDRLPRTGPVLYLGLHRNGAIDGFVYHEALNGPTFMISTQLQKNFFARLFFSGIAVTRTKDEGDRAGNEQALAECLDLLHHGGSLFVFPEGTSSLGPRHLPFKTGALWLILEYLQKPGPPVQVIPVSIHYECPWAFRAKVEVVLGEPLDLSLLPFSAPAAHPGAARETPRATGETIGHPSHLSSNSLQLSRLKALRRHTQAGLEAVGINVVSAEYQDKIQRLAYASTLATSRSYFASLKTLEKQIPEPILRNTGNLDSELRGRRLLFHQGVPLVPMGSILLYVIALALLAPVVGAAMLLNAPPILAGWGASKKFPDDVNVISLWKVLVGIPVFLIWIFSACILCLVLGNPIWLLGYALVTWAGLHLYYRVKKLAVAVHNGLRYPQLRPGLLQLRETVIGHLPPENATDFR